MNLHHSPLRIGFVPSYRFGWTEWTRQMRDGGLSVLSSLPGVEIIAPNVAPEGSPPDARGGLTPFGAVQNLDQAEATAEYFCHQKVDGLVLCPLDFGDERSAVKIAERLDVPVLLYATKEPAGRHDTGMTRVSDSYCGNLSIAAGLHRRKIPFHFAGLFFPEEKALKDEFTNFIRAVNVVKSLKGARIGQIGVRPPTFETVAYDEIAMSRKFGQNVVFSSIDEILSKARGIEENDPALDEAIISLTGGVQKISVANDYIHNAARLEMALTDFFKRNRLSAMAMQCWPTIQQAMKLSTCAIFGRLTGQGMLTACEADILGALSMLVNYAAALGVTPPHFVDWTIQHRDDPNRLLAWHCGNAPTRLARDPENIALRSRTDMTGELPVSSGDAMAGLYQFQIKPGKVTLIRLAEYDGIWKLLIAPGEIIPSNEIMAGTWSWVSVQDHARLYRTLVEEGFIHHASMIHGDQTQALLQACKFLDIQSVLVD